MVCTFSRKVKVKSSPHYMAMHPEDSRGFHFEVVPCQMCINCRLKKAQEWTYRMLWERKQWKKACFITLTYDEDHLPVTACGHATLFPKHAQDFWKRVRRHLEYSNPDLSPPLLRYFLCGEYGEEFRRPHYHAIVFGTDFGEWKIHHYKTDGSPVYVTDELTKLWPFGLATVDDFNENRCKYVVSYVGKKIYKDPLKYFKEYGCCKWPYQSQSGGIGLCYVNSSEFEYLDPKIKGVHLSVPRYYLKKSDEAKMIIENRIYNLRKNGSLQFDESYESMKQRDIDTKMKFRSRKRCF